MNNATLTSVTLEIAAWWQNVKFDAKIAISVISSTTLLSQLCA